MPRGPGDVLDLIRASGQLTRGGIVEHTGLSRVTVAQRVDALLSAGVILPGREAVATGGRMRGTLVFNTGHSTVLTAAVDTTHTRVCVTDLAGGILAELSVDTAIANGPSRTLDDIAAAARSLLARLDLHPGQVCGVGVSIPGPVDPGSGRPSQPPMMPGWDGYPIAEHVQGALTPAPVHTANDADAAALGEHATGFPRSRSLCLVKVATGIGTGLVIDGRLYPGADGGAGDIGHVRVRRDSDALCQCGARGCLAALASGRAVARALTELGTPARSGREVGELIAQGDPDAARLTQDAGRLVGEVLATAVSVLNPEVVLVGGALASAPLLAGVRETLYSLALPRATRHVVLQLGSLGEDAATVGLARLVVDHEYSAEAVNRRLRA
ncbi:MAG: ROK family transcriptional regulator [Dermatophilaceae bacterium]